MFANERGVTHDPGGVAVDPLFYADLGNIGTFDIRDVLERSSEKFFLVLAVGAPGGAVHGHSLVRQALGKRIEIGRCCRSTGEKNGGTK